LVVMVGPTAVGKTGLAVHLAERFSGEIISADSRQFYRRMDIGTAKPSRDELQRVFHHLIDVAEPGETWSLSVFQQAARQAVSEVHARGHLPFLVGGTGQYVHAVTHGWSPPSVPPDPFLRKDLEKLAAEHGGEWLHQELSRLDPEAASRIDPANLRRTIRALEVIRLTGQKFSLQRKVGEVSYRLLTIGLTRPRPVLYARVDARIEAMFSSGLLAEVDALLKSGVSPNLPAMTSIGYRECVAVLQGEMPLEEAKTMMRRSTRDFIRRQANWFKQDDPSIHWFDLEVEPLSSIESLLEAFLQNR